MEIPPPVNTNVDEIADRAKYSYATGSRLLAAVQHRLGDLAAAGRLDPVESWQLQDVLVEAWWVLYQGTLCAVRDEDTDDDTWDEVDNTYSDGRTVNTQIRIEPWGDENVGGQGGFTNAEGAVHEYPRGTISDIAPIRPEQDEVEVGETPRSYLIFDEQNTVVQVIRDYDEYLAELVRRLEAGQDLW